MVISRFSSDDFIGALSLASKNNKCYENIVIHSSLSSLGMLSGCTADGLIRLIVDYFGEDKHIYFPTFSYSYRRKKQFNQLCIEESIVNEMGVLSMASTNYQLNRTDCPMFSYNIIGKEAEYRCKRRSNYCFSSENIFGRFFKEKTQLIGIGISYSNGMTPFMYLEKQAKVPFRFDLKLHGEKFDSKTQNFINDYIYHFAINEEDYGHLNCSNRNRFGAKLVGEGISKEVNIGNSMIYCMDAEALAEYTIAALEKDPFIMTKIDKSNDF